MPDPSKPKSESIFEWWGLLPEWTRYIRSDKFEEEVDLEYAGPGWYTAPASDGAGDCTFLVVPANATRADVWAKAYEGDIVVYYWYRPDGAPVGETFNAIINAPTRTR